MQETEKRIKIDDLKQQLEIEKLVSDKIKGFIEKKKGLIAKKSDGRDRLREKNIAKLEDDKTDIKTKDEEARVDIQNIHNLCDEAEDERRQRELKDDENANIERQKE
jgi:hypothetical protein